MDKHDEKEMQYMADRADSQTRRVADEGKLTERELLDIRRAQYWMEEVAVVERILTERVNAAVAQAEAEAKRLRKALEMYGTHRASCPINPTCNCGLRAALSAKAVSDGAARGGYDDSDY